MYLIMCNNLKMYSTVLQKCSGQKVLSMEHMSAMLQGKI